MGCTSNETITTPRFLPLAATMRRRRQPIATGNRSRFRSAEIAPFDPRYERGTAGKIPVELLVIGARRDPTIRVGDRDGEKTSGALQGVQQNGSCAVVHVRLVESEPASVILEQLAEPGTAGNERDCVRAAG